MLRPERLRRRPSSAKRSVTTASIHCRSLLVPASLSSVEIHAVDPRRDARWEAFLGTRPEALVYQHPAWLRVLERTYGYEPVALAAECESGEFGGVLPLVRKRGLLTG